MSASPLRLGVIGCGFFAENHLNAWAAMEGVELAAVCDLDPDKARAAAHRFGAPRAYTDADEMLDTERLDFVDIATTMTSHQALVALAARRGLPTIVQKPLAPDWQTCRAIVETCRDAAIPFMVHENTRFLTPIRRARAVIDSGGIGVPNWARVSFRTGHDIYGKQPYLANETHFVILDLGVHMLDVARYLMGEVASVYCQSQKIKRGIAGEDKATILMRHGDGATSLVECSYASPISPDPFPQLTLQVEGSRGSLRIDPGYRMTVFTAGEATSEDVSPAMLPWSTPPWHGTQESVQRIQEQWVRCLRNGTVPETSGEDSLRTYGLVFAAYESAADRPRHPTADALNPKHEDAGMARPDIKIGVTADLFGKGGRPMFGDGPLEMFGAAGFAWETVPPNPRGLDPDVIGGYDALFIGGSPVNEAALFGDTGRLKVVARNGVGFDAVDVAALTRRGIMLVNTPAAVRNGVATSAVGLILALTLRLPLKARLPREGRWSERVDHPGVGLPGRTLGIVGLGGIGREIVRLMAPFDMRVLASDPHLDAAAASQAGTELAPLDDLLARSDIVVIACYLDETTFHLIDRARLALMKPSAFLVNIARGPIIDEPALIEALAAGRIAGAGLDVFEQEPPDPANPLFAMDSVIATAHSLCWTDQFLAGVAKSAIADIIQVLEGGRPTHLVNPGALDRLAERRFVRAD